MALWELVRTAYAAPRVWSWDQNWRDPQGLPGREEGRSPPPTHLTGSYGFAQGLASPSPSLLDPQRLFHW